MVTTIRVPGECRAEPLDSLGAEPVRHPQVEHEHVRVLDGHLVHRGLEVGRLADDVQIILVVQQPPEAPPQTGMVIGEHDTSPRIVGSAVGIAVVDWVYTAHATNVGPGAAPDHRLSLPVTHGEVPSRSR